MSVVPCLVNCEHRVPSQALSQEPVICGRCGDWFLRPKHEPTIWELDTLKALKFCQDEAEYAFRKTMLNRMRGSNYCNDCRFNPVPMSERIQ